MVLGTSVPTDLTTETAQGRGPGACCGWEVRAYFEPGRAAPPCVHRLTWVRGAQLGPCAPQAEGWRGEPWAAGGGRAALGAVGSVGFCRGPVLFVALGLLDLGQSLARKQSHCHEPGWGPCLIPPSAAPGGWLGQGLARCWVVAAGQSQESQASARAGAPLWLRWGRHVV